MPLITAAKVAAAAALAPLSGAEGGAVHPSATKAAAEEMQVRALGELRTRLGATAYQAALPGDPVPNRLAVARTGGTLFAVINAWEAETGNPKARIYAALSVAASLLSFVVAVPTLNLRGLRVDGGFIQTTGFGESKESLMSASDVAALQTSLRGQVDTMLGDLLTEGSALGLLDVEAALAVSRPAAFDYPVVRSLR